MINLRPAVTLLLLSALAIMTVAASGAAANATQETVIVGMDTIIEGNGPTSLGEIEPCRRVEIGETFDIDLFATGARDITGFGTHILYDPEVINITAVNPSFLLGPGGLTVGGTAFPDTDGDWQYAYAQAVGVSGDGVLIRISLRAISSGTSPLNLPVGPLDTGLFDSVGQPITITGIVPGEIRVGEECPPTPSEIIPLSVVTPGASDTGTPDTSDTGTPDTSDTGTPDTSDSGTPGASDSGTPGASDTGTPDASDPGTPGASDTGTPGVGSDSTSSSEDDDDGFPLWVIAPIAGGIGLAALATLFAVSRLRRRSTGPE